MFLNGLLGGLAVGLVFMFLWRKLMRAKRLERWQQAGDSASLSLVAKPDQIEEIVGYSPKWMRFGEFEEVGWLNTQLKELWPYVNKAVRGIIQETVEPMLDTYEGGMIANLEFTHSDLGSNSPDIRGVKVHSWEKNQVVLDMDVFWQGNCKFKLKIVTVTRATVKPCIQDLSFTGTLRLILELTDKVPLIAAYVYALNRKPAGEHYVVDFGLTGAGLAAIPGLKAQILNGIHTTLDDMMLWPRRQAAALIEGYDISHLELQYSGEVIVTVVKCEGLPNMDQLGKSDPRVAVYVDKKHQFTTKVVANNLNPTWDDEVFRIPVDDVLTATLFLRAEDEDTGIVSDYDVMGYATLPLADLLQKEVETEFRLPLYNSLVSAERIKGDFGHVTIKAIYRSFETSEERKKVTEAEKNWDIKQESKNVPPAEAAEAIKKAVENAKERVQNMETLRGVGHAADKLVNLQKGKLAKAVVATQAASALAGGPLTGSASSGAIALAGGPQKGSASSGASAAAAAAAASIPASSTPGLQAPPSIPPAVSSSLTAPPADSLAAAVEGATAAAAETLSSASAPGVVRASASDSDGSAPIMATASTAASGALDKDEEKHGSRHRVSTFFKGMKGTLKGSHTAETEAESPGHERPPTPGSATPRRSGIFGALKKKPAEA